MTPTTRATAEARTLRAELAQMDENIADLTHTLLRIADAQGWQDARCEAIEMELQRIEEARAQVVRQLQATRQPTRAGRKTA